MQLDEGTLEEPEIAYILQQVLRALAYVHAQQRVHRDVKAANVLLSVAGAVKISDFGVSGQMTGASLLSKVVQDSPCQPPPALIAGLLVQALLASVTEHHALPVAKKGNSEDLGAYCWCTIQALLGTGGGHLWERRTGWRRRS